MSFKFLAKLTARQQAQRSLLCVGLDPDPRRLPLHLLEAYALPDAIVRFNHAIIEATQAAACAFKLNFAFYEALGADGWHTLAQTIAAVPDDAILIADAKRGDIGNTARFYADAIYNQLGCDACTVSPYMGRDCVQPFLEYEGRAVFVLARTSNPGADDLQDCTCGDDPLYLRVARLTAAWATDAPGTGGLVAGATDIEALAALRAACPRLPFLIPGIGAQGGDPQAIVQAAATEDGPVLVNSSRSILYASGARDYAEAAAREAEALRTALQGSP